MKNRFCVAAILLILATVCLAGIVDKAQAYDILNSKWNVGPNNATFIDPNNPPATPGSVTWSPMASGIGLHPDVGGYDGHADLSTDIEFLVTPAVDGLEYALFDQALSLWGSHARITNLGQVADSGAQVGAPESLNGHIGDIRVAGYSFDGAGGGLAHALQPAVEWMGTTFGGDVHFDIAENWTNGGGGGTDFLTVAIHELGHSLGLGHSGVVGSVMEPFYAGVRHQLHRDDIIGIQAIYGTDYAANASFDSVSDTDVLNLDLGTVTLGDPTSSLPFDISNLQQAGSTATLTLASNVGSGSTTALTTDLTTLDNLVAGTTSSPFNALLDSNLPGVHNASYDLNFTDVTGTNQTLTLNLTGAVVNVDDPAKPDLVYDVTTGEVWLDARDVGQINLYNLQSDYQFIGANHTPVLGGVATSQDHDISEASLGSTITTPQSIGNILAAGLTLADLANLFEARVATTTLGQPEVEFDLEITCGAGDANCDGYVDIAGDILPTFSNFTGPGTFSLLRADGDVEGMLSAGDDDVDVSDLLAMFGNFTGPPPDEGGLGAPAEVGDPSIPDLIYDATTGEVILDVDGSGIIGYVLKNGAGTFLAGNHTPILGGVTTSLAGELSEAALSSPGGANSIGFVFPAGMNLAALSAYLTTNEVSRSLGAPIVPFDLVVLGPAVPEPSTVVLAAFGLLAMGFVARRKKRRV